MHPVMVNCSKELKHSIIFLLPLHVLCIPLQNLTVTLTVVNTILLLHFLENMRLLPAIPALLHQSSIILINKYSFSLENVA